MDLSSVYSPYEYTSLFQPRHAPFRRKLNRQVITRRYSMFLNTMMVLMARTPLDGCMTLQSKTNEAIICLGRLQDISQPRGCLQSVAFGASPNRGSQTKCVRSPAKPPDDTVLSGWRCQSSAALPVLVARSCRRRDGLRFLGNLLP